MKTETYTNKTIVTMNRYDIEKQTRVVCEIEVGALMPWLFTTFPEMTVHEANAMMTKVWCGGRSPELQTIDKNYIINYTITYDASWETKLEFAKRTKADLEHVLAMSPTGLTQSGETQFQNLWTIVQAEIMHLELCIANAKVAAK